MRIGNDLRVFKQKYVFTQPLQTTGAKRTWFNQRYPDSNENSPACIAAEFECCRASNCHSSNKQLVVHVQIWSEICVLRVS